MEHTSNYELSKWAESDRILMEDFNMDHDKIDAALAGAGNCKIVTGSYVGTGEYGSNFPNTLTFNHVPYVLMITSSDWHLEVIRGSNTADVRYGGNSPKTSFMQWGNHTVSWYSPSGADAQLNANDKVYTYVALLAAE